jgi:hypothetical protein
MRRSSSKVGMAREEGEPAVSNASSTHVIAS